MIEPSQLTVADLGRRVVFTKLGGKAGRLFAWSKSSCEVELDGLEGTVLIKPEDLDFADEKSARKLQPYQVQRIRQMRKEGFTRSFIAELFAISLNTLNQLLSSSTYKDIR